jgi:hypothetical protein
MLGYCAALVQHLVLLDTTLVFGFLLDSFAIELQRSLINRVGCNVQIMIFIYSYMLELSSRVYSTIQR